MIERNWQQLIRPEKPQVEAGSDPSRKMRVTCIKEEIKSVLDKLNYLLYKSYINGVYYY